jgi:hypothetical protein
MTLNSKQLPSANAGDNKRPEPLEAGTYPARLVQVATLGVQKERPYKGEDKPPRLHMRLTYEFLDEFLKDDEGNDVLGKPRWLSEEIPFYNLKADLAKSTKRYYALDPDSKFDGDWGQLLGAPCMVTVVQEADKRPGYDRIYEQISNVSSMRPKEAAKAPELKNTAYAFDFYNPDMKVFESFPDWIKDKIRSAVDFGGSALEKALTDPKKPVKKDKLAPQEEDQEDKEEAW